MAYTLDCSSFELSEKSVAEIFKVNQSHLMNYLRLIEDENLSDRDIYDKVTKKFGFPESHSHTVWFHGTRVADITSFEIHGILTKSEARKYYVEPLLIGLSLGMEKIGENLLSKSIYGKSIINDEGPFAFLIKAAATHAIDNTHSYIDIPEMVEDIAGCLVGENPKLIEKFKENTKPFVIPFLETADSNDLIRAVYYLYFIAIGRDPVSAANIANTCFNGEGESVSPEKIKIDCIEEIELLRWQLDIYSK